MTLYLDCQSSVQPFPWAGVVLHALASAALSPVGVYCRDMNEEIGNWEAGAGQAERASGRLIAGNPSEMNDMTLEIIHVNGVLNQITVPWGRLFQAVDWSSGKDVALPMIEPGAETYFPTPFQTIHSGALVQRKTR